MLNIIYRPYSGENTDNDANVRPGHRPSWFSKIKIHKSLFDSIIKHKEHVNKVYVLFDGAEGVFKTEVLNTLRKLDALEIPHEFRHIEAGSVYNSLKIATELAVELGGDTYLVEDDYFHEIDAIKKIVMALPQFRILSGYDHPDRYNRTDDIPYNIQIKYDIPSKHHWRTSESTGHSYAIQGELLEEIKHILLQHEHMISDRDLWRHLHNMHIPLWTPIPGFTTQVDQFLSPGIEWEDYSTKIDKRINVFGGTGFVGSKYCEKTPNVIVNKRDDYTLSPESDDVVYFISTVDNYNIHIDPHLDINTNLNTLIKVLESCKENKNLTFNFISSWFVYGNVPLPANEESLCDPKGFYSITKRAAEQMLISYCETFGLKYRILRLCNVLGKDDKKVSKKKNALQYMIGELLENRDVNLYDNGMVYRDYMHVDDVINAINLIVSGGKVNEIYNIGSGVPTYIRHAMEYALQQSKSTSLLNSIPPTPFHDIVQTKNMVMDVTKLKSLGFTPKYNLYQTIDSLLYK